MATIKGYTNIEQSRKLAEILPLESADMSYKKEFITTSLFGEPIYDYKVKPDYCKWSNLCESIPCWSLAALLGILPMIRKDEDTANSFIAKTPDNEYYVVYATLTKEVDSSAIYDNPVDACVEMVIKLYELNLL